MNNFLQKLTVLAMGVLVLASASSVLASGESNCQTVYGGGEVCNPQIKFTISKLVQVPGKGGGSYVDNLGVNDIKFATDQDATFKIVIKNTGNADIKNISVVDTFPQYLTFVAGVGSTNKGASKISFNIGLIKKGETKEYLITSHTAKENELPNNQAVTCVINNVRATDNNGGVAEDNSQICIQKNILDVPGPIVYKTLPPKEIPSTGPEMLGLIGLIPTGLTGIYLRRKYKKN